MHGTEKVVNVESLVTQLAHIILCPCYEILPCPNHQLLQTTEILWDITIFRSQVGATFVTLIMYNKNNCNLLFHTLIITRGP